MKKRIRFFALIMTLILIISAIPAYAIGTLFEETKLLYIVDSSKITTFQNEINNPSIIIDLNQPEEIYGEADTSEAIKIDFSIFDYVSSDDVTNNMLRSYKGIAIPYGMDYTAEYARTAYDSGRLVYVYGGVTIENYKNTVGISDFSINTTAYNAVETETTTVKQSFDIEYEQTELYNVISYSNNSLLCKFANTAKEVNYLVAAAKNCAETNTSPNARATIVQSVFDNVTYWGTNNNYSVHLDYTLYIETDEIDPYYDYFAIKTRVWVESASQEVENIKTKYELSFPSIDNLIETGPESQNNIGTLDVSCGFGSDGTINASIGYSIDLSDQRPTIERTENFSNETVEWTMRPRTLFPPSINDAHLVCVATWAATDHYAAINVYYRGILENGSDSNYTRVPIRFENTMTS